MATRRWALGVLGGLFALSGCSLTGLDEVETVTCEDSNAPCDALNADREGQCEIYQCAPGGLGCALAPADWDRDGVLDVACEGEVAGHDVFDCDDHSAMRSPEVTEAFDAVDNDCDQIIDEGAPMPAPTVVAETQDAALDHVAYTATDEALIITHAGPGVDAGAVLRVASDLSSSGQLLKTSCKGGQGTCNLGEVVSAPAGERLLTALVEFEGCAAGRLRVGELDLSRGSDAISFPDAACARTGAGIDLDPDQNDCTGLSRAAPGDGGSPRGAARVALVAQAQGQQGQALVAWLGDDAGRARCGGPRVPLEAVGLWSSPTGQLAVTGAGAPLSLGLSSGGSRPALLSWAQRGYFVAHAGPDGVMQLQFLEKLDPGAGACGADNPALVVPGAATEVGGEATDFPALALGKLRPVCEGADVELGLAWQEGCGGSGRVVFAQLGYAKQTGALCVAAGPTLLAEGDAGQGRMQPSIAFVEHPFVTDAFAREDGPWDGELVGGFVVAWVQAGPDGAQVVAQRVAAADGLPVGEPLALTDGVDPAAPGDVFLHALDGELRATFHADDGAAFYSGALFADDRAGVNAENGGAM